MHRRIALMLLTAAAGIVSACKDVPEAVTQPAAGLAAGASSDNEGAVHFAFTRFASINYCDAEPTGILFDKSGKRLFVDIQHRGGDGLDKTVAISRTPGNQ